MINNILEQYAERVGNMIAKQKDDQVIDWIRSRGFIGLFFKRWLITITDMKDFKMKEVSIDSLEKQ